MALSPLIDSINKAFMTGDVTALTSFNDHHGRELRTVMHAGLPHLAGRIDDDVVAYMTMLYNETDYWIQVVELALLADNKRLIQRIIESRDEAIEDVFELALKGCHVATVKWLLKSEYVNALLAHTFHAEHVIGLSDEVLLYLDVAGVVFTVNLVGIAIRQDRVTLLQNQLDKGSFVNGHDSYVVASACDNAAYRCLAWLLSIKPVYKKQVAALLKNKGKSQLSFNRFPDVTIQDLIKQDPSLIMVFEDMSADDAMKWLPFAKRNCQKEKLMTYVAV